MIDCPRCGFSPTKPRVRLEDILPFPALAGQNVFALPDQLPEITKFIRQGDEEAAFLDAEVERMQVALKQLTERRDTARLLVSQNQALLSQVHRLPNELVSNIFGELPFTRTGSVIPPHEPAHFDLWRITWVCRRWRGVAIGLAKLWCKLAVVYRDDYPASHAHNLARTYLARARDLPLSIALSTEGLSCGQWAIEAGLYSLDTIQRLTIRGISKFFWREAFLEKSLPALTELDVDACPRYYWDSDDEEEDDFYGDRSSTFDLNQALEPLQMCPMLDSLTIRMSHISEYYEYVHYTPAKLSIPWSQLRILKLSFGAQMAPVLWTLGLCKAVEELTLNDSAPSGYGSAAYEGTKDDSSPVRLSRLSVLHIEEMDENMERQMCKIVCPNLVTLTLTGNVKLKSTARFGKFVQSTRLQNASVTVRAGYKHLSSSALWEMTVSAASPTLATLEMRFETVDEDDIQAQIARWLDRGIDIPQLEELYLVCPSHFNQLGRALAFIVGDVRTAKLPSLRTIKIEYKADGAKSNRHYEQRVETEVGHALLSLLRDFVAEGGAVWITEVDGGACFPTERSASLCSSIFTDYKKRVEHLYL